MTGNHLIDLVDKRDFRTLFIDELGWNNPDRPDMSIEVDDDTYTLHQVADYKGLRIWHCPVLPQRKIQRQIDVLVGKDNQERLVIFTNEQRQEWRWPRRAQLSSANAKLLVHEHLVGDRSTHLIERLQAIELDFDENLPLVELLDRMRDAFDHEAETASVAAARLMGTLYAELDAAGVGDHESTLLLARLLFLLFGDDADMWTPAGLFENYLREHTMAESLHTDLRSLFTVADTDIKNRALPPESPYTGFPYINGGLFRDSLHIPVLTPAFRESLLEACEFNWSIISPAVFGSMFQTVKSKDVRRHGGEHYTTEENILKTIRPLFLDEFRERLDRAWDDKAQLTKLHNDLGRLRFLDPACGCGNFLIVAYKELRALELGLLTRRRELDMTEAASKKVERAQLSLDVTGDIKVTLDHFSGIEIEEWPARIAETAMLLVDHLANQQMAVEFGVAPDRLPIRISPKIKHANSLEVDWSDFCPVEGRVFVVGNPPYLGPRLQSAQQKLDQKAIWGSVPGAGTLDYVTNWFLKAARYIQGTDAQVAFVSTNSITQGGQPAIIWSTLHSLGMRINFAYRTFVWGNDTRDSAAVHCVVIGFSFGGNRRTKTIWTENYLGSEPRRATNINPFLLDAQDMYVWSVPRPIVAGIPPMSVGNEPRDGGHLSKISAEDADTIRRIDPVAAKYLRRLVGAREHLNAQWRYCLWLADAPQADIAASPVLRERVALVAAERNGAKGAKGRAADRPWRFGAIFQPGEDYLLVPSVSSKDRMYIPVAIYGRDVIVNNSVFWLTPADLVIFAFLQSRVFTNWVGVVSSRMKSDFQISVGSVYNTFPFLVLDTEQRGLVTGMAAGIVAERARYPELSLAQMYEPDRMPIELRERHSELDIALLQMYGLDPKINDYELSSALFGRYAAIVNSDQLEIADGPA
ncbi:class I SAM-dependent DNA methyltransferase [Nocardia sp. NPDC050175]|uniref:class I SAM-dependent DNA methyltransferase n=1 Tax=Nocardia sp. NPDC050175 TaxID=3364317 RepID=UPI0037AB5DD5